MEGLRGLRGTSDTRLGTGATVAVLPPEWAGNQALAAELEDKRFPYLEERREALTPRGRLIGGTP